MKKQELGQVIADTLHTDFQTGLRLAGKFQLLARKYRKNLIRRANGEHVDSLIEKTESQISNLCHSLSISFKLVEDYRGPSLLLDLGYQFSDSIVGGTIVDDDL